MNTKFVVRGVLLALPVTVVALMVELVLIVAQTPTGPLIRNRSHCPDEVRQAPGYFWNSRVSRKELDSRMNLR